MLNRRSFVASAAVAVLAPALPAVLLAKPALRIYADGINDDAPGLQAYLDGQSVAWADGRPFDGVIEGRLILLHKPIKICPTSQDLTLVNNWIEAWGLPYAISFDMPVRANVRQLPYGVYCESVEVL